MTEYKLVVVGGSLNFCVALFIRTTERVLFGQIFTKQIFDGGVREHLILPSLTYNLALFCQLEVLGRVP